MYQVHQGSFFMARERPEFLPQNSFDFPDCSHKYLPTGNAERKKITVAFL